MENSTEQTGKPVIPKFLNGQNFSRDHMKNSQDLVVTEMYNFSTANSMENHNELMERTCLIVYIIFTLLYAVYALKVLSSEWRTQSITLRNRTIAELLYTAVAIVTALGSALTNDLISVPLCHGLVSLKTWLVLVSMVTTGSQAITMCWFSCRPQRNGSSHRWSKTAVPMIWVCGLGGTAATMTCYNRDMEVIRMYTVVLCEDPQQYQPYIVPVIVFISTLTILCNACIIIPIYAKRSRNSVSEQPSRRNPSTVLRHKESVTSQYASTSNPNQSRKISLRGHRLSTASTVEFYDTILQSNEFALNDPDMFCIPELNEDSTESSAETIERPYGPACKFRSSISSLHRPHLGSDSVDTLVDITESDYNVRKASMIARRGSTNEQFNYARPIELYFKISTCTTIDNTENADTDSLEFEEADDINVPRIEIISPTTVGRSISSGIENDKKLSEETSTAESDPMDSKQKSQGVQTTPGDFKSDSDKSKTSISTATNSDKSKTSNSTGTNSTGMSKDNPEEDFMDLKLNCSIKDQEKCVSTESETSTKVSKGQSQGQRSRSSSFGTETSVIISRGKNIKNRRTSSECSIKTKIEFNQEGRQSESNNRKTSIETENGTAELNSENLSKVDSELMNNLKKAKSRKTSNPDFPLNETSPIRRHSLVEAWVDCHASYETETRAHATPGKRQRQSFSQQVTIMDVVKEDHDSGINTISEKVQEKGRKQSSQSVKHNAPKRRSTRNRPSLSIYTGNPPSISQVQQRNDRHILAMLVLYLFQWLPMGAYIIWCATNDVTSKEEYYQTHMFFQYACQLCVMLGSAVSLGVLKEDTLLHSFPCNLWCKCHQEVQPIQEVPVAMAITRPSNQSNMAISSQENNPKASTSRESPRSNTHQQSPKASTSKQSP